MRVEVGSLYKVQCTEYERGYGQRDMGTYFFTTEQEAKEFCERYASGLETVNVSSEQATRR